MGVVRCHFCHKLVTEEAWESHRAAHLALKDDGQQTDYACLPESLRYQGSLEGVPQWYVHRVCGVTTGMPEFIIRTYLVEPNFYTAGRTFCHGCSTHVPEEECYWRTTQESLHDYFLRLQQQFDAAQRYIQNAPVRPQPIAQRPAEEKPQANVFWEDVKTGIRGLFGK